MQVVKEKNLTMSKQAGQHTEERSGATVGFYQLKCSIMPENIIEKSNEMTQVNTIVQNFSKDDKKSTAAGKRNKVQRTLQNIQRARVKGLENTNCAEQTDPKPVTRLRLHKEHQENLRSNVLNAGNTSQQINFTGDERHVCKVSINLNTNTNNPEEQIALIKLICGDSIQFFVQEVRSMMTPAGEERGLEFILEVPSRAQGQKLVHLVQKSNKGFMAKLVHEVLDQSVADNVIQQTVQQLLNDANELQAVQNAKINEIEYQLSHLSITHKFRSMDEFEATTALREAKGAKLQELVSQRTEFTKVLESCKQRLIAKPSTREAVNIREAFDRECTRLKAALPIYAKKSDIINTVIDNQVCVILGETGSGKSTQLVQYMHDAGLGSNGKGQIVCTQPRKVAAISLARHVAQEFGCHVGETVGYRVGNDAKEHADTAMKYVTDRVLLNEYMKDSILTKYSCIIVDEAHERTLFTDLLLGLLKQLLRRRPELRLIITSATIDPDVFVRFFNGCPVLRVSGRLFPIQVNFREQPLNGPEEDHVTAAVTQTWQIIQSEEGHGGILVFLTSLADIDNACDMLLRYPGAQQIVHCLPLHGRLQPDEQQRAFDPAPPGKRKVVFATNVAETSVTIPGITCVIDTGMAKEKQYDAKRNMARLQMCMISQSSAKQRQGRAGRTEPGICYRLYTKEQFASMRPNSQPEILCTHLGLAILLFLEMGISNPHEFDFVESPPREALQAAMATLEEINAVNDGKLTDLGNKLVKLGLEPRYGKFLLRGIEENIGFDALCTVALCTAAGGVFYRGGTEEEKNIADKRKVRFCHEKGDILTNLNVFREWWQTESEKAKTQWCFANSINAKSMRTTRETVNEIRKLLSSELKIKLEVYFSENAIRDATIPSLILECFGTNLARFTGHKRKGYFLLKENNAVILHPSSSLCSLGTLPKWVIYEQALSTSQDFVINITTVDESEVIKAFQNGRIACDFTLLELKILNVNVVQGLGNNIVRKLIGPKGSNIRQLESSIEQAIAKSNVVSSLCVLEIECNKGNLSVFCATSVKTVALAMVAERIDTERNALRIEVLEKPLLAHVTSARVTLQAGASVKQLLMPEDFRALVIEKIPESMSEVEMLVLFERIGPFETRRFKSRNWGCVTFADVSHAKRAADLCVALNLPAKPQSNCHDKQEFSIVISWLRRPANGCAYVDFESPMSAAEFMLLPHIPLIIRGRLANVRINKKDPRQLFIQNLPETVTNDEISQAIEQLMANARVTKVVIPRKKIALPADTEVDMYRKQIDSSVRDIVAKNLLRCRVSPVNVLPSKPETAFGRAFVGCNDINCAITIAAALSHNVIANTQIEAYLNIESIIYVKDAVHRIIVNELNNFVTQRKNEMATRAVTVDIKRHKSSDWQIHVRGRQLEHTAYYRQQLAVIVSPYVYDTKSRETFQLFKSKSGQDFIKNLMLDHNLYIDMDRRFWTLNVFGALHTYDAVRETINRFIATSSHANVTREISLRDASKPRGLLKELFARYGFDMERLKAEVGALSCAVDVRRHSLAFSGSAESLTKLEAILDEIASMLALERLSIFSTKEPGPECAVCLSEVEDGNHHHLELCGHSYCQKCLQLALDNALQSKTFPIICCHEGCSQPLALADIQQLLSNTAAGWQQLVQASVDAFVSKSVGKYQYCLTVDCPMIYQVTEEGTCFQCPLCRFMTCTRCKVAYHQGLTCDIYQRLKSDPDDSLRQWLSEETKDRGLCPKCHVPIEKNGGCNHMHCRACDIHICWVCKATFATGNETYDHQAHCPGVLRA